MLVGHSLGAAVCMLVAAAAPSAVRGLVMIESLGLMAKDPADLPLLLMRSVQFDLKLAHTRVREYATREEASIARASNARAYVSFNTGAITVTTTQVTDGKRCRDVGRLSGEQFLSLAGARALVARGTRPTAHASATSAESETSAHESSSSSDPGPVVFAHDRRAQGPSPLYLTEEQVRSYLSAVTCPTLVVLGNKGITMEPERFAGRRAALRCDNKFVTLPGHHHLHLDPETAPAVCRTVVEFVEMHAH